MKIYCKNCEYLPNELRNQLHTFDHCLFVTGVRIKSYPINEQHEPEFAEPGVHNLNNTCEFFLQKTNVNQSSFHYKSNWLDRFLCKLFNISPR